MFTIKSRQRDEVKHYFPKLCLFFDGSALYLPIHKIQ
jgi:hypothetical protein